jgi:predicted lipoprotein with Yx(FWY)xxD motif
MIRSKATRLLAGAAALPLIALVAAGCGGGGGGDNAAAASPPKTATGQPTAGSGLNSSLLGTTPRSDGKPQVTYNGHPLYTFVMDQSPGDTNGQGSTAFGGGWFALNRSGNQVTATQSTTTTDSSGGGIGY